jgi:YHS domain-containing protein
MSEKPADFVDPLCGMTVDVARAEASGLTVEHEGRTYAFCRSGCKRAFLEEPHVYAAQVEAATRLQPTHGFAPVGTVALPVIDEGMRRWYESCSCCLSDAYPEIKAQLDAERAATTEPPVDAGICEVAEAGTQQGAHV